MDEIVPAFTAMHENGGRLPTECIFAFAHQFSSDVYTGLYNVADYTVWRSGQDQAPIYDWHKRHLQTLQWVSRAADDALGRQGALPPLRPAPRLLDLPRCPRRDHPPRPAAGHRVAGRPHGDAALHALGPRRPRRAGRVHGDGPRDADGPRHRRARRRRHPRRADRRRRLPRPGGRPARHRRAALRRLGPAAHRRSSAPASRAYLAARHTGRAGGHDYSFADTGLDLATHRALVAPYQERFGVPSEV